MEAVVLWKAAMRPRLPTGRQLPQPPLLEKEPEAETKQNHAPSHTTNNQLQGGIISWPTGGKVGWPLTRDLGVSRKRPEGFSKETRGVLERDSGVSRKRPGVS